MQNDEYISRFSHELRNPLTLIYSSLQLLEKECPSVRESVLWDQIQKDMLDVIQLLKDMSAPFCRIQMAPIHVVEFLSGLSASFASSMRMRGICFITELPDDLSGLILMADKNKLRQAVTNLVLNAADAVGGRSLPGKILLSARNDGSALSIHIRDNGPGIPQEYLADLFDPFVTHKPDGTGLGLSIVKIIAEQHGGYVTVDTRYDTSVQKTSDSKYSGHPADSCEESSTSYTDFCLQIPTG